MCVVEEVLHGVFFLFSRGGQYDKVLAYMFALTLCKYDLRNSDLFGLIWTKVRRVCLGIVSSVVFIGGGGYCCEVGADGLFWNFVWGCADVCCVL